ncbi:hypothetical protein [Actinophytocola oryzae]|uniref:Uncharacterized protein n=1 Tax=Actinophytocola oryzae TaxID=502181 RepID=A0A4V3FQ24_9PSEU|nr:hypothetical protein [Actinophytocola oryzae]TDV34599.1 hypothetical protein CLV71_13814 [Actinophytocola oryzae]
MDVIGRTADTPAPPADPSPDLLDLDQIVAMVAPADPQGWYRRAEGFDEVHRRLQDVSDEFRKQAKAVDAAWYGATSDGYSSRVEHIAVTVDHLLRGPDYGSLFRRAGDALAAAQRRLNDLRLQRDQDTGADPAPSDEQARQIFTDLAAAYEDVGQTIAGDPALLAGAPAPPVVTLTSTGVDQQGPTFDVDTGSDAAATGPGSFTAAPAGGFFTGTRVGPAVVTGGGSPARPFGAVFGRGAPPEAAGMGPAAAGPPARLRGGGPPAWAPMVAAMPPSIGRPQTRTTDPYDDPVVSTVDAERPGVAPDEIRLAELTSGPAPDVLTETLSAGADVAPQDEAATRTTTATAEVTASATAVPVTPVPAPPAPATPPAASPASAGVAGGTSIPVSTSPAGRVPAAPVLSEGPVASRPPVSSAPLSDPVPGRTPVPQQPSAAGVLANSGETVAAPRPAGAAPGAAEGGGMGAPMAGGGGPLPSTQQRGGGTARTTAGRGPAPESPASWDAEEHPFPVLGRRRRAAPPAGTDGEPPAPVRPLPRLPMDFLSRKEEDDD